MRITRIADRERERAAYEAGDEEAMDAAGMNTYFTKKYGDDWAERFGNHFDFFIRNGRIESSARARKTLVTMVTTSVTTDAAD
jgi:hypothetical protein